jgi:hypothetical protein
VSTEVSATELATLAAIADLLIPAADDMPSAADVVGEDRVRFVLTARPDLADPVRAALRTELGDDPQDRLDRLAKDEPANLGALQLTIVGGYYTDRHVRELIGYPGQMALTLRSWEYPAYLEEGHIDAVLARGPSWRDPATGQRAVATGDEPQTYEQLWSATTESPEGGPDGHDGT